MVQVSSPANTTLLSLETSWSMILSSEISYDPKLLDTSIKVGRLPVVRPFSLCIVVVGGSAINLYSFPGAVPVLRAGAVSRVMTGSLFWL